MAFSSFVPASLGSLFNHQLNQKQNKLSFSPFLVPKEKRRLYSSIGSSQQNGISIPTQVPKTCSHKSKNKWYLRQSFQHYSPRLSTLIDDQESVENLSYEQERSEYESSLRSQDGYASRTGLLKAVDTFVLFTRPYAAFGTIVGGITASLFPVEAISDLSPKFFLGGLQAVVATTLMQTFVSGINHLYDVEIDKINKQHFPLASGEYSTETAWAITCIVTLLSFGIGFMSQSKALFCGLLIQFIFGGVYSINLPFLRWKRNPLLATFCLMCIHSFSIYIPNLIHAQGYLLGRPIVITKSVLLTTALTCIHCIAIGIFKDIPDTKGDKENGIQTFSTELGREKAFSLGINVILVEYGIAVIVGASTASTLFSKFVVVAGHCLLALALWFRSRSVDLMNNSAALSFYKFIWKLFYVGNVLMLFYR